MPRTPLARAARVPHLQSGRPPREEAHARRQDRAEELLRAASIVLARQGLRATTMDEVAKGLGIPKAVLYRYFPSKDELIRSILRRVLNNWSELQARPWRGLRKNLLEVLALARSDPSALILLVRHCANDPDLHAFHECLRQTVVERTETLLKQNSEAMAADKLMRSLCAQAVTGFMFDAVLWWIEEGVEERDADFLVWARDSLNALYRRWLPDADWGGARPTDSAPVKSRKVAKKP